MSKDPEMGPGRYDTQQAQEHQRNYTAVFFGQRPDNVFGVVPDYPGPTDYTIKQ